MVGRTLVDLSKDYVSIRVANLSQGRKKLRRGTEVAVYEPVASISPSEIPNQEAVGQQYTRVAYS